PSTTLFRSGFIMPTLILTVQNSVPKRDIGSATAGVNFFRQIGASFGTALIGSMFVSQLTSDLSDRLPADAASKVGEQAGSITPDQLAQLPPYIAHTIVVSYADALIPLYRYLVPLLVLGLIVACFLKEKPLLTTINGRGSSDDSDDPADPADFDGTASGQANDSTGEQHDDAAEHDASGIGVKATSGR